MRYFLHCIAIWSSISIFTETDIFPRQKFSCFANVVPIIELLPPQNILFAPIDEMSGLFIY